MISASMDEATALGILRAERKLRSGDVAGAQSLCLGLERRSGSMPELDGLFGRIALERGDAGAAVQRIQRAIAADPEVAAYRHALGNALQDQGKLDRAIAAYRRALALRPESAEAWNDLGTAFFAKGFIPDAEGAYRRAIALAPAHSVAHENLGALLRSGRRVNEARRALQRALWARFAAWSRRAIRGLRPIPEPDVVLAAAQEHYAQGQARLAHALASAAVSHLQRAVELAPGDGVLRASLADELARQGRGCEAEEHYRTALERAPDDGVLRRRLGKLLHAQGRGEEALEVFREFLRREPRSPEAHFECGAVEASRGRFSEAEAYLIEAVELAPAHPGARVGLGDLLRAQGKLEEAARSYEAARRADPDYEPATLGIAQAWFSLGQNEKAIGELRSLVARRPRSARAHRHLGGLLRDSARTRDAILHLETAIRLAPHDVDAMRFLSNACGDLGRYDEARAHLDAALVLAPKRADLWNELGILQLNCGHVAEAERSFRLAIEGSPDIPGYHNNLGQALIVQGRLAEGWPLLEFRGKLLGHVELHGRFALPRWAGEPIAGKSLLVYAEQGLGDEIVFASCLPDLARTGARCIVECDQRLEGMFRRSFPHVEIKGGDRRKPEEWFDALDPKPDLQVGAGSLPKFFRRSLAEFPRHSGYLKPDFERVEVWRRRLRSLGAALCVGISWKGGLVRTGELRRTLSLERLAPILRQRDIAFVSLQYTEARADLARLHAAHGIRVLHWQETIDSYEDTAALVCALDGVLSVCTALVHLSGALGRPVWVMAPHSPGWRYRIGERNPWYPSVELFEQRDPGDWDPVLDAVRARLAAAAAGAGFRAKPDQAR